MGAMGDEPAAKRHRGPTIVKKQGTLDLFTGRRPLPSYFLLRRRPNGEYYAEWSERLPGSAVVEWGGEAKLGESKREVSLREVGLPDESEDEVKADSAEVPVLAGRPACTNVSLLKSLLQKAVRRRQKRQAVWAAGALLVLSPDQLLRRLPIVALEDVALTTDFPTLVWMMAASSKGWVPRSNHLQWLLNSVATLCEVEEQEVHGAVDTVVRDEDLARRWGNCTANLTQLLSLKARLMYGGMQCDMSMLRWYTNTWHMRFQQQRAVPTQPASTFVKSLPLPAELPLEAWIPAACDFHCSNIIPRIMTENPHLRLSEDTLKRLMWDFSSSVNTRRLPMPPHSPSEDDKREWDAIKRIVMKTAQCIIKSNLRYV